MARCIFSTLQAIPEGVRREIRPAVKLAVKLVTLVSNDVIIWYPKYFCRISTRNDFFYFILTPKRINNITFLHARYYTCLS